MAQIGVVRLELIPHGKLLRSNIGVNEAERFRIAANPREAGLNQDMSQYTNDDNDGEDDDELTSTSDESDLGLHDATNHDQYEDDQANGVNSEIGDAKANGKPGSSRVKNPVKQLKNYNESKKGLHRNQRGLMQWKPMRNLQFAKDEAKFAVKRTINKTKLEGRQPDVETEA